MPLGVIAVIPGNTTHIDYIAVDKRSRSMGLGGRLLEWARLRYGALSLECRRELVPYYTSRHFIPKYTYRWHGISLVYMSTDRLGRTRETSGGDDTIHPSQTPALTPKIPIYLRFIEIFFKKRVS